MNENSYEDFLNIKTTGEQTHYSDSFHYNKYEATNYHSLDILFKEFNINKNDCIVDFGCGKGRLNFYANNKFNCKVTGIEMDEYYIEECNKNKLSYLEKHSSNKCDISFINCLAEEYKIDDKDNIFYFFNPFSVQIFMKVVENILDSIIKNKREIYIVLYYPSNEYIFFLDKFTPFNLEKEVKVDILHDDDPKEKFLIYKLLYYSLCFYTN